MNKIAAFTFLMIFWGVISEANAQPFQFKWKLDSVRKSGFYDILISPEISSKTKVDFSDLRIVDELGNNTPHLIQPSGKKWLEQLFREFPIVSNTLGDSSQSILILSNPTGQPTTQLKIFLQNSSVSRPVSLSGSKDGKQWYIIDDKLQLNRSYEQYRDQYVQDLDIPLSNYQFFKLVVNNLNNDPVNILKAGSYLNIDYKSINPYISNPQPLFRQTDTAKETIIDLNWPSPVHVDKLSFLIDAPKFFNRQVSIYLINRKADGTIEKGSKVGSFTLRSGRDNSIDFPRIKTSQLLCVIENDDNPPLRVKEISGYQFSFRVVAYLENNHQYSLLMDNPTATSPNYDLSSFKDSIPALREIIQTVGKIEKNDSLPSEKNEETSKWWIWPAIFVLIFSLSFLTYRLVMDMKKRDS